MFVIQLFDFVFLRSVNRSIVDENWMCVWKKEEEKRKVDIYLLEFEWMYRNGRVGKGKEEYIFFNELTFVHSQPCIFELIQKSEKVCCIVPLYLM